MAKELSRLRSRSVTVGIYKAQDSRLRVLSIPCQKGVVNAETGVAVNHDGPPESAWARSLRHLVTAEFNVAANPAGRAARLRAACSSTCWMWTSTCRKNAGATAYPSLS